MVDVGDIASIPLFASLDEADLTELARWFDVQTAGAAVNLTSEGAAGYSFFILVEGAAVVTADGEQVATFGPGDFFGEMAIVEGLPRSATVTSTSPVKLLVMFGTEFRQLQQSHPAIAAHIEAIVRQRREELQQRHASSDPA